MDQPNFVVVCCVSFVTCFVLLGLLAAVIRAVTMMFPERPAQTDAAVTAAIASAVASIAPGFRVVEIQEIACSPSQRPRQSV